MAGKKRARKHATNESAAIDQNLTLEEICGRYLASLDQRGAGLGTISSYDAELNLALRELGKDTIANALTSEQVAAYFASDVVMRTRSGTPKARATFEKSKRVLRQALVYAEQQGLIAKAPLPEEPAKV